MIHPAHYHNAVIKHLLEDDRVDAYAVFYLEQAHDHKEWELQNEHFKKVYYCQKKIDIISGEFYNPDAIRYFIKNSFDMVIISGRMPFTSYVLLKLCKIKGVPYIFSSDLSLMPINGSSISLSECRQWKKYKKIADSSVGLWVPGIASINYWNKIVGNDVSNKIIQGRYLLDKESVIVNGEKKYVRNNIRHELGIGENEFVVLFVGKLIKSRNICGLLQAHELLKSKGVNSRLIIIGDGEDEEIVTKHIEEHGHSVIHIESVAFSELNNYYQASDCYVHPGREPYSLAVVQAVYNKMPVITTCLVGAAYDYIKDHVNGYIIQDGTGERIADALCNVIDGRLDLTEIATISDNIFQKRSAINVANNVIDYVLEKLG